MMDNLLGNIRETFPKICVSKLPNVPIRGWFNATFVLCSYYYQKYLSKYEKTFLELYKIFQDTKNPKMSIKGEANIH